MTDDQPVPAATAPRRRTAVRVLVALTLSFAVLSVAAAPFTGVAAGVLGLAAVVTAVFAWGHARPDDSRALRLTVATFVAALVVGLFAAGSQGAGVPVLGDSSDTPATVGSADGATSGTTIVDEVTATVEAYRPAAGARRAGVPVLVTNASADTRSVVVELLATDASGEQVARTEVVVDGLASGASRRVIAFTGVSAAVRQALTDADVTVAAISGA